MAEVKIYPLVSPWGRFGLYSFFIDAPEPAVIDTGIATSPAHGMAPTLADLGRRIEDVRWILCTHGHLDHVGGAHALRELTGGRAEVVIHQADAPLLRSRRAHVELYLDLRARYLQEPDGEQQQIRQAQAAISGELEPAVLVKGGETLSLGGGVSVSVHAVPGHTAGSVAYLVDGQDDVFVGDAVQVHGAANGFPGYQDPDAYRASLRHLRDDLRIRNLYLGHPYRTREGVPYGVELDAGQARKALQESLDVEARIAEAAHRHLPDGLAGNDSRLSPLSPPSSPSPPSPYAPFAAIAAEVGYTGDPTLEPSPFFTTLHGYRSQLGR